MHNITVDDLNSITQLFYSILIIGFIFSSIIFAVLRSIALSVIKRINFPHRIKTESGYLYRSLNGTYVAKQRADEIFIQRKMKKRQFWIKRHEYIISRLKRE
ncbi:hypothetical protein [Acinetobacter ursingii]|uniref:hypothetical protein n=1 Tax=Acinetobacter ursingii TaxID=108980 RepID=UPI003AF6F20C